MTIALTHTEASTEVSPPRMEPLARLPVFLALEGRRAFVAGGTPAAAWKAELLSAAGAAVEVYAAEPCEELLALAADPPRGTISLRRQTWQPNDIRAAAIAVGACDTDDEAAHFTAAARAAGVPVNVIDKPKFCDFSFGAIVNRSPLVIGISTDGAAPTFGQAIRMKLEALIPRGFARWAEAAKHWRCAIQQSGRSFGERRQFWRAFAAFAMRHPDRVPAQSDYDLLLAETATGSTTAEPGLVTLVGAGPGDPELLTLRAVRAMQSADLILFDRRVSPEILEFARREAKKMLVAGEQDEVDGPLIDLAKSGRRVVRLLGCGSSFEGELAACRKAGVPVEVVPGIAAAPAATITTLGHRRPAASSA